MEYYLMINKQSRMLVDDQMYLINKSAHVWSA